ncbi:hypothetical protein Btru_069361 [Bulinus truncatus]|nr:hypothetical protein Btru_069361 [Bulinus truncatus]
MLETDGMQSSKREGCQIEHCSDSYETAKQDLDIKGPGPHDSRSVCMAIRTYKECMYQLLNSCNGDLMFYTARNFIQKTMNENKCDEVGPTLTSPATKGPDPVPVLCDYRSKGSSKLCVLFGDPHLRTFNEEFQTCKVKGAWPLVNNDYLTVQVTNNPVEGTLDATATSKVKYL